MNSLFFTGSVLIERSILFTGWMPAAHTHFCSCSERRATFAPSHVSSVHSWNSLRLASITRTQETSNCGLKAQGNAPKSCSSSLDEDGRGEDSSCLHIPEGSTWCSVQFGNGQHLQTVERVLSVATVFQRVFPSHALTEMQSKCLLISCS